MMMRRLTTSAAAALLAALAPSAHARAQAKCSSTAGTITVATGFCIDQVADSVQGLRHFAVAANGDIYAASSRRGLLLLRDTDHDGDYDTRTVLYTKGGNDVVLRDAGTLYYTTNDAVLRIRMNADRVAAVDTIVQDLPARGGHTTKSIAFDKAGALYVDIGSATNSCQENDRTNRSPGHDPCTELDTRAGVWKFTADKSHQTPSDGKRYATGLRNVVAFTSHPATGQLFGVQHGRDQLAANWGFTNEQSAELPAEVMVQISEGDDFGWPYCYYDQMQKRNVLAPEYGGDGRQVGRCASKKTPVAAFPGHWAPESILFYTGSQFPARFRNGAFIVFHGSWNRAPLPQAGFRVMFQPLNGVAAAGEPVVFASGFDQTRAGNGALQPMGIAQGPDGSLYVGSDNGGMIWRIRSAGR